MNDSSLWLLVGCLLAVFAGCSKSGKRPDAQSLRPVSASSESPSLAKKRPEPGLPPDGILPLFSEVALPVGIEFERYDDIRGLHRLLEGHGGGVALFDFDNDTRPDVFFTNGCRSPRPESDDSHSNQLYRNGPEGMFSLATEPSGLTRHGYFLGCTVGDFDNDGFDDLYVTAFGDNVLWQNQGDGTFRDVTAETGTAVGRWSTSPAFADLNGDGNLDLFVVTYVEEDEDRPRLCPNPASRDGYSQCSPTLFPASDDVLFLNDGSGGFTDVTRPAGVAGLDGKGLGIAVFDADQDGRPDVFVANDGTPNFLYINQGNDSAPPGGLLVPRFLDRAFQLGVAVNSHGKAQAGMGVAVSDVDGDGLLDVLDTNFYGEGIALYRNRGPSGFEEATNSSLLGPASRHLLGFGAAFFDAENDGWPDLVVTNGHVDDVSYAGVPYRMPPQLFRSQHDGRFLDVTRWAGPYFQGCWLGRGLAVGDLDGDGDQDIVVSHQLAPSAVLRNDTRSENQSINLRLVGTGQSNRSAFHALVKLEGLSCPTVREVAAGGSFQSASDRSLHIGLGTASALPMLEVHWPDGTIEALADVPAGRYLLLQGRGLVVMTTSTQDRSYSTLP